MTRLLCIGIMGIRVRRVLWWRMVSATLVCRGVYEFRDCPPPKPTPPTPPGPPEGYCTDPNDHYVTLANLPDKNLHANDVEYDYLFKACVASGDAGSCTQANNAVDYCSGNFAVCQCKKANHAGYPLGDTTKATWTKNSDGSYQVSFAGIIPPSGGDARAASIQLVCDPKATSATF